MKNGYICIKKRVFMKDKIIITAPLPPPIHGMSLATSMLIDGLSSEYDFTIIDTATNKNSIIINHPSIFSPNRFFRIIFKLFRDCYTMLTTKYKVHYLCTGANYTGTIKYLPYVVISRLKNKPYIIHIHNGSFKMMYDSLSSFQKRVIKYMFGGAFGVIALGESLSRLLDGVVSRDNIYIVENCVDDEFVSSQDIISRSLINRDTSICKVLYLSNLMEDKGIKELMQSILHIDNCELHLAGAIEESKETEIFVSNMLRDYPNKFIYHGIVSGAAKDRLLKDSDIFALPSRYKTEGQPISILEAYSNGLSVVTDSRCGGISDIFTDGVNGIDCESENISSIVTAINGCKLNLDKFAYNNYEYFASKFKKSDYINRVEKILKKI